MEVMIHCQDRHGDRDVGILHRGGGNGKAWGVQTSVEALLRPVHNFFGMPRNLRVRSCKQGNPKIITAETKTKDRV